VPVPSQESEYSCIFVWGVLILLLNGFSIGFPDFSDIVIFVFHFICSIVCLGVFLFFVFNDLKWKVVVRFIDIVEIVDHHCLNFLFISNLNYLTHEYIIRKINTHAFGKGPWKKVKIDKSYFGTCLIKIVGLFTISILQYFFQF